FGMAAAEALAAGAPVLLSRCAGVARALERVPPGPRCAVLVDPGDVRGAARQLVEALDAPAELARMTAAGSALARETMSWPHGAARLLAMLDELAALPDAR